MKLTKPTSIIILISFSLLPSISSVYFSMILQDYTLSFLRDGQNDLYCNIKYQYTSITINENQESIIIHNGDDSPDFSTTITLDKQQLIKMKSLLDRETLFDVNGSTYTPKAAAVIDIKSLPSRIPEGNIWLLGSKGIGHSITFTRKARKIADIENKVTLQFLDKELIIPASSDDADIMFAILDGLIRFMGSISGYTPTIDVVNTLKKELDCNSKAQAMVVGGITYHFSFDLLNYLCNVYLPKKKIRKH
jgi:hypothetical protein